MSERSLIGVIFGEQAPNSAFTEVAVTVDSDSKSAATTSGIFDNNFSRSDGFCSNVLLSRYSNFVNSRG